MVRSEDLTRSQGIGWTSLGRFLLEASVVSSIGCENPAMVDLIF